MPNREHASSDPEILPADLQLSPEQMRRLGYQVVDMLVEHFAGQRDRPVSSGPPSESTPQAAWAGPPPADGVPFEALLDDVREIMADTAEVDHPRFFAYVPGPGNFVGVMADALAAGFNVFAGSWQVAHGPALVEHAMIDWLRDICGLPQETAGLFVSGGSVANLTALAAARAQLTEQQAARCTIYYSDQTHSSVERALNILGIAPSRRRSIPGDDRFRLSPEAVERAVAADRSAGFHPFCIIATAGTTNAGAVDPLPELAALCRRESLWLHVDGAYGAAAALSERGRDAMPGLELADSLSLDPHKWLFQPFECGCVLVRRGALLEKTFHTLPEYMRDSAATDGQINFRDRGIQLTRSFRALKLWMSLHAFGTDAFRTAIDRGIERAEQAEEILRRDKCWEIITAASLGVVTFRYLPHNNPSFDLDELQRRIVRRLYQDGFAMVMTTAMRGVTVLRLCTINPRTSYDDLKRTIDLLARFGAEESTPSA